MVDLSFCEMFRGVSVNWCSAMLFPRDFVCLVGEIFARDFVKDTHYYF